MGRQREDKAGADSKEQANKIFFVRAYHFKVGRRHLGARQSLTPLQCNNDDD